MERIPVFEYMDLPEAIREALKEYYAGTDHRGILNDSYVRFPYLFDLQTAPDETLERYFLENGVTFEDGYVIIHFDW